MSCSELPMFIRNVLPFWTDIYAQLCPSHWNSISDLWTGLRDLLIQNQRRLQQTKNKKIKWLSKVANHYLNFKRKKIHRAWVWTELFRTLTMSRCELLWTWCWTSWFCIRWGIFLSTWMKANFYFILLVSYFLKHKEIVSSILLEHDVISKGNQISMFWGNIMASNSGFSRSS